MPIELAERAISSKDLGQTIVAERPVTPKELEDQLFITIGRKKEKQPPPNVDDEYNNKNVPILKPLKSVIVTVTEEDRRTGKETTRDINYDKEIEGQFEYLSRTHQLEVDTPKTKALQDLVDKMLVGSDLKTRVAIMNKGESANAFVFADGTILVSQSLLNELDSSDEIAAVLAHEIEHLENKTFENKIQSHPSDTTGVGWAHEGASDTFTPSLLEKADLNSLAFKSAIQKVSGVERGIIHQGGNARASEQVIHHYVRNYRTSNKPYTAKPEELERVFTKTNLEVFEQFYEKKGYEKPLDPDHLKQILLNLHPHDFDQAYSRILRNQESISYPEGRMQRQILENANSLIFERLRSEGFSDTEITTFLVYTKAGWSDSSFRQNLYLLKNSQQFDQLTDNLRSIGDDKKLDKMSEIVFGKSFNQDSTEYGSDYRRILLSQVQIYFYVEGLEERELGVPVTEDTLVKFLAQLGELYIDKDRVPTSNITNTLLSYVDRVYLPEPEQAGVEVDEQQIRNFFEKVKATGVMIYPQAIENYVREDKEFLTGAGKQKYSVENQQVVKNVFCEVFEYKARGEETFEITFEKIDKIFDDLDIAIQEDKFANFRENIVSFISKTERYFKENNLSDQERLRFIEYMDQKISQIHFKANYSIRDFLKNDGSALLGANIDEEDNDKLMKFNLRTYLALNLFKQDGKEFYSYMEKVMRESGINYQSLNQDQLFNLCQGFLVFSNDYFNRQFLFYGQRQSVSEYMGQDFKVEDFEHFFNLPFLKQIFEQEKPLEFSTIAQLNEYIDKSLIERSFILKRNKDGKCDLYGDSSGSLILGKAARENFLQILSRGISDQDYGDLYQFIDKYYSDGTIKNQLLSDINKQYLRSENVSLEEKTDYLLQHYDRVGAEGTKILAEQITDLQTFTWFRGKIGGRLQEYLKGSRFISTIAMSDFLSSYAVAQFGTIFETTKSGEKDKKEESTKFAESWFKRYFHRGYAEEKVIDYDKPTGKFIFNKGGRIFFQTIADTVTTLKNLSSLQRLAFSHKLLTEIHGALAGEWNRLTLAHILTKSLGLKKGFISDVLVAACKKADAAWISFPASKMIAPLLFRGLDLRSIDFDKLSKTEVEQREDLRSEGKRFKLNQLLSRAEIGRITNSDTRQITFFGAAFRTQPNSLIAGVAQDSDRAYFLVQNELTRLLAQGLVEEKSEQSHESEIDPSLEAVIAGVEASGALGVRALQLTTQMMQFSPAVEERLSRTLDANPGLDKVWFWENLYILAAQDPKIREFLAKVKLGNYLGGGSLYTTYSATLDENGESEEIVLKMLNPNAEAFISNSYEQAKVVLADVAAQKGAGRNKEFAKTALMLLDLSKKWSEEDIHDSTFEEDDDRFKGVVDSFNQTFGEETFYVPVRKLNTTRLKSETKAKMQTVNQLLHDNRVSQEDKKGIVQLMGRFLAYQLSHAPVVTEAGKTYRLLHSDPHVGNYVVDTSGGRSRIAVIDRHMYLKLEEQDVAVLEKLVKGGNDNDFVYGFIDRVLDTNNVQGTQRQAITSKVFGNLRLEYVKQRIKGKVDRFALMRTMLSKLSEAEIDIPLNLRLMIRNIGAIQELARRNGVDIEALYKEAA